MNKFMKNLCSKVLCIISVLVLCITSIPCEQALAATRVSYTGSEQYRSGQFYENLTDVTLTGDIRDDIVAVALSQVGYREGNNEDGYSGEIKVDNPNNYTEYGRWNYKTNGNGGQVNHAWCASFVAWCARLANIPTSVVNNSAGSKNITQSCPETYTVSDVTSGVYTPQPGDLIYFTFSHVGIVVSYDSATQKVTTVEGNTGTDEYDNDGVYVEKKTRSLTSSKIGMFGCLESQEDSEVTGPSTLKIAMTSVPTSVNQGSSFNLAGTVSSNYKITSVNGYIKRGTSTVQSASCAPNSTSMAIKSSAINTSLKFGTLPAGTYTLQIDAKDTYGETDTYTTSFTVKAATSTLTIAMTTVPSTVTQGSSFNLAGTVSSNYKINSVKGYIMSGSTTVQSTSCVPNSTSLAIRSSTINTNLKFASLPTGIYTLKIIATDTSGTSYTYTKTFTVKAATSTLKIAMTAVPTSITKGSSFNLAGTVSSNYKITSVKGYIMSGSTTVQSTSCAPNSTSLAIGSSAINKNLKFGSLVKGTYTLKIVATDSIGKSVTYTKSFTVK